ncbi:hypothetical protein ACE6H2_009364 [Prunus campanulata]
MSYLYSGLLGNVREHNSSNLTYRQSHRFLPGLQPPFLLGSTIVSIIKQAVH